MAASGGIHSYTLGGIERHFGLLTVDDLITITGTIPTQADDIIDLERLDKWAKNPIGCEHFLTLAAQKTDRGVNRDTVKTWGSIRQRCIVAADLFAKSVICGEEVPAPKVTGEASGMTGISTPDASPTTTPA